MGLKKQRQLQTTLTQLVRVLLIATAQNKPLTFWHMVQICISWKSCAVETDRIS